MKIDRLIKKIKKIKVKIWFFDFFSVIGRLFRPKKKIQAQVISPADKELLAVMRSTKTTLPIFVPLHNHLRMRFKWYYRWHLFEHANKIHISVASIAAVLIFSLVISLFPSQTRANNYTKLWTSTADFNTGTNSNINTSGDEAKLSTSSANFTEGFTGTTYKDAATTANWDTSAHKLTLQGDPTNGTMTDLEEKIKAITGANEQINASAYDSANHFMYFGGSSGNFFAYNPSTQVVIKLTYKISANWSTSSITSMAYDSTNQVVYLGGVIGNFGAFKGGSDPANGTWYWLKTFGVFSTNWSTNTVQSLAFDSANGVIYLGGMNGKFGAFKGGATPGTGSTWYYLTTFGTFSTNWSTNTTSALTYDSVNHIIYLGGSGGKFGAFNGGATPGTGSTWYYLTTVGTFSANWGANPVNTLTFDSTNSMIYLGGTNGVGLFGAFNGGATPTSGTWTNLSAKVTTTTTLNSLTFDPTNHFIYISGDYDDGSTGIYRQFLAFTANATPASNSMIDLNARINTDWNGMNESIATLTFDNVNNIIYLGGNVGRCGSFNGGSNPAAGTWTSLYSKSSSALRGSAIVYSLAYDSTNHFVYLGMSSGYFFAYNVTNGQMINLTSKIGTNWSSNAINSLAFDSTNSIIYLGGAGGKFGAFKGGSDPSNGSWYYLTTFGTFSTNWSTNSVSSLTFDSANGNIYLGGAAGKFGAFKGGATPGTGSTWYYLTTVGTFAADWGASPVTALTYDSINHLVYLSSATPGKFGAFNGGVDPSSGTWTFLGAKLSGGLATGGISSSTFDQINGFVYLGGSSSASFGAYNGGATPASGTFTDLSAKVSSASFASIGSLTYAGDKIYLGGDASKFGMFSTASNPTNGSYTSLNAKISNFWDSSNQLSAGAYAADISTAFIAGWQSQFAGYQTGYITDKNGISLKVNTTQTIVKATLTATESKPANTAIVYYLSSNGGSNWYQVTSGAEYTFAGAGADLRWKANLTTTNLSVTPEVSNIAVSYTYLTASSGTLNLKFDASQSVAWNNLSWNRTLPANTTLGIRARVASSDVGLASATYSESRAVSPVNLTTISVGGQNGLSDSRFIEIEIAFATSDNFNTPTLSDITLTYVINMAPELQSLTVSQATDGSKVVNISYQLRDQDAHLNPYNQDRVSVSFQYSTNSGSNWSTPTMTSGTGLQTVDQTDFRPFSAAWNVNADLANSFYNNTVKFKVIANDNELAHNLAELVSGTFSIDTKNPVPGAIGPNTGVQINGGTSSWANNALVDLTLSVADDSARKMEIRNDANFSQNGSAAEDYAASKTGYYLSEGDGDKTVYVRFYDLFGNYADSTATILLDTTAPSQPLNSRVYDTSDKSLSRYSLTLIWDSVSAVSDFNDYIIERKVNSDGAYSQLANSLQTTYTDTGLDKANTYYYRIKAADIHSNFSTVSSEVHYQPDSADTAAPEISGPIPSADPTDIKATISWITNEAADSFVEYGTTANYGQSQGKVEYVNNHSVQLVGLSPSTKYYYRVDSTDSQGNRMTGPDQSFTTTWPQEASSAPSITGATAQKPGADPEEVTIIWTTDKYSTSQVLYGVSESLGQQTEEDTTLNKTHYITITKLKPNTKYYYKARSKDSFGNEVLGELKYFVTSQSGGDQTPSIAGVEVTDITLDTAIISWETTVVTTSVIEYGNEATYGSRIEDISLGSTTKHVVRMKNLQQGTKYHFRVLGESVSAGTIAANVDSTFETQTMPTISEISAKGINSLGATITWKTNTPADSFVDFGIEAANQSQGRSEEVTDHAVTLIGLKPATTYQFTIKSRDKYSNQATSPINTFKTIVDTTAPIIRDMKSEVSIITDQSGSTKAQAIISWSTDEPTTSQVKYAMGVASADDYPLKTEEELALSTSHVVIISNLQPSATYHMRLISKDASGNIAVSDDYTVLTLNQEKSLIQYIVQILEDRFSWVKGLGLF